MRLTGKSTQKATKQQNNKQNNEQQQEKTAVNFGLLPTIAMILGQDKAISNTAGRHCKLAEKNAADILLALNQFKNI